MVKVESATCSLTCADLFCGAGGFSEGFRQAGFRVTKALDVWRPAVVTHEKNHPDTQAIHADILSYEPGALGPVDVLIGSPPCTEFSLANRGGNGDIEAGLRLVYRFLRFVYELQPRWWVMENVPRVLEFLPDEVPLRSLGIAKRGALPIPVKHIFVSADYGAPQLRRRAFSGSFPIPSPTHPRSSWRTLRDVVEGLPDPLGAPPESVRDPLYGSEIPGEDLTDHYGLELLLSPDEVRQNRKAKEDHSWYGKMSFPDELDRPARTVMATNLRVSRETIVVPTADGRYRRLSVREAACVQGFPITYQWWAGSTSLRYKLVGNAVAPPIAFAVAREISAAAHVAVPERPYVISKVAERPELLPARERQRRLPVTRRFRDHIPGSKLPGFRVDFDNLGKARNGDLVRWRTVLYRGSGKTLQSREVGFNEALDLLSRSIAGPETRARALTFLSDLARAMRPLVPQASDLQRVHAERATGEVTPSLLVERIGELVAAHFSDEQRVLRTRSPRHPDFVPVRIAATLVATAYAGELANTYPRHPRLTLPRLMSGEAPRLRSTRAMQDP